MPQALQVIRCALRCKLLYIGTDLVIRQRYACMHMFHNEKGIDVSTGGLCNPSPWHGIRWVGHAGAAQPGQVSAASLESQSLQQPAELSLSGSALRPSAQPPARGPASGDGSSQNASMSAVAAQLPGTHANASQAAPAHKPSAAHSPAIKPAAAPKSSVSIAVGTVQMSPPSAAAVLPPAKSSASKGPPGPSSSQAPTRGPQETAAGAGSSLRPVPAAAPPGLQLPLTARPAAPPQSVQTPISSDQPSRPVLDTTPSEGRLTAPAPVPQGSSASSSHQAPAKIPVQIPAGTIKVSRPGAAPTSPAAAPLSSGWTGLPPFYSSSLAEDKSTNVAVQTEELAALVVSTLATAQHIPWLLVLRGSPSASVA